MYEVFIDKVVGKDGRMVKAKTIYYTFSSVDVSALVRPQQDTLFFPVGSQVVVKKYGLNDAFAEYLRALAIETDWKGGVLYGPSESLPTNLSNGALGFFSTCAVITDTLEVK